MSNATGSVTDNVHTLPEQFSLRTEDVKFLKGGFQKTPILKKWKPFNGPCLPDSDKRKDKRKNRSIMATSCHSRPAYAQKTLLFSKAGFQKTPT